MAESKKPARPAPPPPARPPDPGSQLEELNDQLARFLQHADQLVDEWARFGADVRRTVDGEVGRIDQSVSDAGERAIKQVNAQVDRVAAERFEKAIEHGLQRLRVADPGRAPVAAAGGTSAAASAALPLRPLLAAIIAANFLLIVLLVMVWRRDAVPAAAVGNPDSGGGAIRDRDPVSSEVLDACAALAAGNWSTEAAELVVGAGLVACGPDAPAVRTTMRERLAATTPPEVDAGPVDASPPVDAKPKKPR